MSSAKVPKVGSVCKGILALALQIQDYCPSYKVLQGLLRPCEDCKDSTYLVIILYSTTSNHLPGLPFLATTTSAAKSRQRKC